MLQYFYLHDCLLLKSPTVAKLILDHSLPDAQLDLSVSPERIGLGRLCEFEWPSLATTRMTTMLGPVIQWTMKYSNKTWMIEEMIDKGLID